MMAILVGCLMLVMSVSIFAFGDRYDEGQVSKTQSLTVDADLWATVHPYAKVCITHADDLFFTGAGGFKHDSGDLYYNIETNFWVTVTGKGKKFKSWDTMWVTPGIYELETEYGTWVPVGFWGSYYVKADPGEELTLGYYPFGKWNGKKLHYVARTGKDITSQPAGHYKASYAITVSAPLWDNGRDNW